MKVKTMKGCIMVGETTGTSQGKEVPFGICYEPNPDRDHGNFRQINTEHTPIIEQEMSNQDIFTAYVAAYREKAYSYLIELGLIIN